MKKLKTVLLAILLTTLSCTPDDQCGTVTDWGLGNNGEHYLWIDGDRHNVDRATWYRYNVGDYLCIEY